MQFGVVLPIWRLTLPAQGRGRVACTGAPDEIVTDIHRVQDLGRTSLTFDFPQTDVASMLRLMEHFMRDVRPLVNERSAS